MTHRIKRVLITGGAGFIGSHLAENLLLGENKIFCVDNFFTGSHENVEHLMDDPNFILIPHDITENNLSINEKIDEIYNLACPAAPIHYQKDPVKTIKANTVGVVNMLELAKLHKAKILQASTSEVYGDPLEHPQKENYRGNVNTIGPRACYDEGKRVSETLFFDYKRNHGVEIRIARLFNTFGPRMALNDGRVVSNFILQALRGEPITVFGDGSQTRSFCYVDDTVNGLIALMENADFTGPVNIGNPNYEFTISDLAKLIIKLTGSNSEIIFKPLPEDDPSQRRPNISLAKEKLNWEPKISIEDGIVKTIEYFKKHLNPSSI